MSRANFFLRIWGIRGDSRADGHAGDMDVSTWSIFDTRGRRVNMGVSTYVPHQEFGGWISQAGKDFGELAITKPLDSGSNLILEAATSGRNLEYVILYCEQVTATGSVQTYYTVLLHNAVVSWYNRFEDRKDNSIFETMRFDPTEVMIKPLRH